MRFYVTFTAEDLRDARPVAVREAIDPKQRQKAGAGVVGWVVVIVLLLAVGIYFRLRAPADPPGTPPQNFGADLRQTLTPYVVGFFAAFVALYAAFRVLRRRALNRDGLLARVLTFDVTDAGLEIIDGPEQTVLQWAAFDRFAESGQLLLVRIKARNYWLALPKRYLTDPAESAAVRRLFEAVAVPPPPSTGGFPVVPIDD